MFALLLLCCLRLAAQSIEVYSEFARLDRPSGLWERREIISPAVARNGYSTFQVVVNAKEGASYFLFCETNPDHLVDARLYKVGSGGQALDPVRSPNFGVIPDGETSRRYLLDVWVPPDAEPGRRVRLELQLKVGDWIVYPMELRIQKAAVPLRPGGAPASLDQVLRRNRAQDQALEDLLQLPEVWFLTAQHIANSWTEHSPLSAANDDEWYLKVRNLLYQRANRR